ncbi:MAG: glycosyltransferase family 2 protein [Gemmatimonadetes bacterium]|nr:glycosyltransferase family 2 protein [Gemmatimonadota bacterium]
MTVPLSLVVCTVGRAASVGTLLRALPQLSRVPDEVIVVDASADDRTSAVVCDVMRESSALPLTYHRVPLEAGGLTYQRNFGAALACGEIISFVDDDTIPETDFFAELERCFARHPSAVGVGGFISNEIEWARGVPPSPTRFTAGEWSRELPVQFRLRRTFGLHSTAPLGHIPQSGYGWPVGFIPPDGADHRVEYLVGATFAFRRSLLEQQRFSSYFTGYGLFEDTDFCVRALAHGELYLATRARIRHLYCQDARPSPRRFGRMVVRNAWFVWRRRWPSPSLANVIRWWATTVLLVGCKFRESFVVRGRRRRRSVRRECIGRLEGIVGVLLRAPKEAG